MTFQPGRFEFTATCLIFGLLMGACPADEPPAASETAIHCLADLKQLSREQIDALYAAADPGALPVGFARGEFLYKTDTRHPRMNAAITGAIWKGKHFTEDGDFINQWAGFRAVRSHGYIGASQLDGRPSLILEYPENTPYFGNMRDEVREVGPGVYLSMVCYRCPPGTVRGCIGLELECTKKLRCR